jgi:outer membrane usher protein
MTLWLLAVATTAAGPIAPAWADSYDDVIQTAPRRLPDRLNPSGRDIPLGGPLSDGPFVLGEVDYILTADDRILVELDGLMPLIESRLSPESLARIREGVAGRDRLATEDLATLGLPLAYDPATFGLVLTLDPNMRPRQVISIAGSSYGAVGRRIEPARLSGYVTAFATADYVHQGLTDRTGFETPSVLLDSAVRYRGLVLENEATIGESFSRDGTRLVYDDLERSARYTAGDLEPVSRGFSGAASMAGLSVVRSYAELEPQRNVQPRGQRTFTLERASTVETFINGRSVQQTRLNPGTYDIRDFPFAQGANDVRLVIRDDTGRENVINFSLNFDRSLLARGLTEFGFFGGLESNPGGQGIEYSDTLGASGFYRRGLTDELTAGGNFRVNDRGGVVGAEMVWASPFGTLGGDVAASSVEGVGEGVAINASFERTFGETFGAARTLTATFQTVSEKFATPGSLSADNRYAWEAGLTYAHTLGANQYITTDAFYSAGRGAEPDQRTLRATYGWRVSPRLLWSVEGIYEDRRQREEYGVRLALTYRFSQYSSSTAEVDTRRERARIGYQTSRGRGVHSWSAAANIDRSETATGVNASITNVLNRVEIGGSHQTFFDSASGDINDQRTSVRAGASLAFADGAFGVSRPIYDSFALVRSHKSLKGAAVYVEPRDEFFSARSGLLGGAVSPELSAYSPRVLTFDVPDAPPGYDLGAGAAQVLPPYRSGYLITVGSDYFVTAVGELRDTTGQPLRLWVGQAVELARLERSPIRIFTNATGRFSIQGMRPGRWRVEADAASSTVYVIDVPAEAEGLVRIGVLRPENR